MLAVTLAALMLVASPNPLTADETEKTGNNAKQPPAISLETLFHAKKKRRFTNSLPATHWMGQQSSELLIRRKDSWQRYDLTSGEETAWPVHEQLVQQISRLEGLKKGQARMAALSAVSRMQQPEETVLVRIGGALALVSPSQPARWLTREAKNWRNATLDPSGRRVAYTNEGDFFVVDLPTGRSLRLTRDGSDTLLDGILDWTYQEEIFGRGNYKGFWFSPDGQWLAMLRIDISGIEPYTLADTNSERGEGIVRRYPKAGDPIPHASLLLWDLRQADRGAVPPPRVLAESTPQQERIITGVWWHEHQRAMFYCVSDRRQTWRELRVIGEPFLQGLQTEPTLFLREESPAWVEPPAAPGWLVDGSIVWRSELPTGRNRLYHISANGAIVTPRSPEGFDVHDFMVRSDGSFAIVTGNAGNEPGERKAYRIQWRSEPVDISHLVAITPEAGWHSTRISPDGQHMIDVQSTPLQPPSLSVRDTRGGQAKLIQQGELKTRSPLIEPELFRISTEGAELPAMLIRPRRASADQKCPVVIEVYGGPQAPVVSTRWSGTRTLYRELLAREGIATLVVDNRSSAGRGFVDTWSIRGRFGEVEKQDVLAAVEWLKAQDWVNADRLAIRGWSFGGFLTLYAMTHSDAFAAGIAGGSVTDWHEYDAFYTERYMGLPSDNPQGYQTTSPIAKAADLHGRVLLIHGESDDNVHPTGTMRMANALQKAGKDFELMIYPGAAHAIHHPGQVWHMTQMTHRFLRRELLSD